MRLSYVNMTGGAKQNNASAVVRDGMSVIFVRNVHLFAHVIHWPLRPKFVFLLESYWLLCFVMKMIASVCALYSRTILYSQ